ncbi:hypothetical protein ABZ801_18890 [Actinomadura sp. NPDC047616]|uniref:hypothetical protein n=1 Tax=Actinomadura sp. NPDC047616 TaxID=3155914 RepID=UPI0033E62D83
MQPVVVYARAGIPPRGVEDLSGPGGTCLDRDSLVAAGQALTWRAAFACGPVAAIPLTAATAVLVDAVAGREPEQWHDRFARGAVHRMAGELTILSVTAGLLAETAGRRRDEDVELFGSAVEGLAGLLVAMQEPQISGERADRIVADTIRTHGALLGGLTRQRVTVRRRGDFTVRTVRSVSEDLTRPELERARTRIGLPWPTRVDNGLGDHVGLAGWRATMQANGDQMWCRVEGEHTLVTELWLRNSREPPE